LRLNVLVQAEKILGVVLSLDGREPVVVGTKSSSDGIFPFVTQEIQQIPTTGEGTYRLCQTPSPFDMVLRLTRVSPLRKDDNGILGFTLRKGSFGDPNPACRPTILLDGYPSERGCGPIRMLHKDCKCIIAEFAQKRRFPVIMVTVREGRIQ
jgi:hypothetical protein